MAQRAKAPAMTAGGVNHRFPPEAFDYNDDVTAEALKVIRSKFGVDVNNKKWTVVDGLGQVVNA